MNDAERLMAQAKKDRGYLYPEWELIAREDPAFMESYNQYYRDALARDEGLPIKYRELVALGILAYRGVWEGALINHIKRAMAHGATKAEVIAALEAAAIPGGAPTFVTGIRALLKCDGPEEKA
ncbi:MAG TPA: carboxymuconolactone decarboxylase family protein [Terriglobales bacterium]|nr:carboxymuconolactone decarboxylase family protein [Terriglobales bacterium]